ncbi:unnamed protein product [Soboliphyme baturini]|uniref:Inositol-pentakisphosphate 2-kinase n=1 Tax=Soboliphyme baturini TaxID=241478 RepID=A0A183ID46_9BILA|nr:unnamed protein product [Soboliphyme baturini]
MLTPLCLLFALSVVDSELQLVQVKGCKQQVRLGQFLRNLYGELLGSGYNSSEELLARIANFTGLSKLDFLSIGDVNSALSRQHDGNLLSLLSAMKVPIDQIPPVASSIMFELDREKDNYFVRVSYHNDTASEEAYPIIPHGCPLEKCPFEVFKESLANVTLPSVEVRNVLCYLPNN